MLCVIYHLSALCHLNNLVENNKLTLVFFLSYMVLFSCVFQNFGSWSGLVFVPIICYPFAITWFIPGIFISLLFILFYFLKSLPRYSSVIVFCFQGESTFSGSIIVVLPAVSHLLYPCKQQDCKPQTLETTHMLKLPWGLSSAYHSRFDLSP